jgi:flavin reductase (DIM6/NTAB) family NADH-FMN oxidoreductase RutF
MTAAREAFLRAMRGVANSVAVVTTDGVAGRHGATVSAFCPVSADPPSLLVCLRADSRIARTVVANGTFCVNVLKDSANDVAERFARRDPAGAADRFDGVELVTGPGRPAILAAATAAFCCRLVESLASGSHLIAVGEVRDVRVGTERPLAYLDGQYTSVSRPPLPPRT